MLSALDVAWFFVVRGEGDPSITQLKLQKLVYYAQGFYLAKYGKPLFPEAIMAWDYGPVVKSLRKVHQNRGAEPISPGEKPFGTMPDDSEVLDFLEHIFRCFGMYSAGQLIDMTHADATWQQSYETEQPTITPKAMQDYFETRLNEISTDPLFIPLKNGDTKQVKQEDLLDFLIENQGNLVKSKMERLGPARVSNHQ